jgi:hypothetical protein
LFLLAMTPVFAQTPSGAPKSEMTFQAVEIYVDSGSAPLAAYQVEFRSRAGNARIVGVEGGDAEPFSPAPHYDPHAIQQERVVIAAFSTRPEPTLPSGRTRVATIHVALKGAQDPDYVIQLEAAAGPGGNTLPASASFEEGKRR